MIKASDGGRPYAGRQVTNAAASSAECPLRRVGASTLSDTDQRARIYRSALVSGFDAPDGGHPVDRSVERGDASDAGALSAGHEVRLGEVETVDLVYLDCS